MIGLKLESDSIMGSMLHLYGATLGGREKYFKRIIET